MYDILKRVIGTGNYKLANVLQKIDNVWAEGEITDAQRDELRTMAQNGANTAGEVDMLAWMIDMDRRMRAMEAAQQVKPDQEEYPAYVEGKWYYAGDKCSENGKNYTCTAPEGVVCVWSPSTYPAYWQEEV